MEENLSMGGKFSTADFGKILTAVYNVSEMHNILREVTGIVTILSNIPDVLLHDLSVYPDILNLILLQCVS